MIKDIYYTISKHSEGETYKDKNSKFIGYAFSILDESQIKIHIDTLKKEHHNAKHWCYAFKLGTEKFSYRVNDDGEPSGSAGMPIYGQIESFEVTNILIVVVRYYGGTKLGVSGLINAYRTGAKFALQSADIIKKTIDQSFQLNFEYKNMGKVMRLLKENNAKIINQELTLNCLLEISVRKSNSSKIFNAFDQCYGVKICEL